MQVLLLGCRRLACELLHQHCRLQSQLKSFVILLNRCSACVHTLPELVKQFRLERRSLWPVPLFFISAWRFVCIDTYVCRVSARPRSVHVAITALIIVLSLSLWVQVLMLQHPHLKVTPVKHQACKYRACSHHNYSVNKDHLLLHLQHSPLCLVLWKQK